MTQDIQALETLVNTLIEFCVNYSFQIMGAGVVIAVGYFLSRWVEKLILKFCEKKKLDVTLATFIASGVKIGVLAFATVIALGKFGITIAPFVAALGAMAFGASLAIQGPLSNYGAGVTIILTRPFVVGDTILVKGQTGVVKEVKLAYTILTDEDGVKITIPNKEVVGQIFHNSGPNKIIEGVIGVSYASDAEKAARVVKEALLSVDGVATDPGPQTGIQEFGDSSVNIGYRCWVPTTKYFQTLYAANAAVYKAVKGAGLDIPFPQREVRTLSN